MSNLHGIVFDLDDTLCPEIDYVYSGFQAVAEWTGDRFGMPATRLFKEFRDLLENGARRDTFNQWLAQNGGEDATIVAEMLSVYRHHKPTIQLSEEVVAMLSRLRRRYRLGIVSDGYLEVQQNKVTALDLKQFVDTIVLSDELGREFWKPHQLPFLTVTQKLGCQPEEAIYAGDNPTKDFYGARSIGMQTVHVRSISGVYCHDVAPSHEYEADHQVDSVLDVESLLTRLAE